MNRTIKIIEQLLGSKIIEIAQSPEDDLTGELFFGFVCELPNGSKKLIWILGDIEGNVPGALEIEDLK